MLKGSFLLEKANENYKNLFPFMTAFEVFFLASSAEMQKNMNQKYSNDNEIKNIPVEGFKPN